MEIQGMNVHLSEGQRQREQMLLPACHCKKWADYQQQLIMLAMTKSNRYLTELEKERPPRPSTN